MNFNQLYYKDAYRDAFTSKVISCDKNGGGYDLILGETCFYPEGGGQSADRGTINGQTVTDVRLAGDQIIHRVGVSFPVGARVRGRVDLDFRYRMMQMHTAEHIVSGIAHSRYGCNNVGFHMAEITTLDLDRPLTEEQLGRIEREANEVVFADRTVEYLYPKPEELDQLDYRSKKELDGDVRIVRIPGADDCACCGLHVHRTGEIGLVKILSFARYKGGVRIEMTAGRNAYEMSARIFRENAGIAHLLSVKPQETMEAVEQVLSESAHKDRRIASLNQRYFQLKADSFAPGTSLALCTEEGLNGIEIRKFCDLLVKEHAGSVCAVLCPDGNGAVRYCIGSGTVNLKEIVPEINSELNGRGGGSPEMIQGTFRADVETVSDTLARRF